MQHIPEADRARAVGGFTLVELLVVISIIAVLASMLLPAIGLVKRQAGGVKFASNLRQVGVGMLAYVDEHDGRFVSFTTLDDGGGTVNWQWPIASYLDADYVVAATDPERIARSVFHDPGDRSRRFQSAAQPNTYTPNVAINGSSVATEYLTNRVAGSISHSTEVCMLGPGCRASGFDGNGEIHGDIWAGACRLSMGDWASLGVAGIKDVFARHGNAMHFAFVDGHVEAKPLTWVVSEASIYGTDLHPLIDRTRKF